ncbi:hypothetical protein ACQPW1_10225 [Nocardia sp. CA-128927]|uniref:hypothetical protein n=1 Tax=Nocardia sp. CA-128927 TaxID=3239975 RepID=UPI003D96AA4D
MARVVISPAGPRRVSAEVELWRETGVAVSAPSARAIAQYWVETNSELLLLALGHAFDAVSAKEAVQQRLSAAGGVSAFTWELAALAAWLNAETRTVKPRELAVVA